MAAKEQAYKQNVMTVRTPISVIVARKSTPVSEILDLAPGSVLRFGTKCGSPLSLDAGGKTIAQCRAVSIGVRMGVRVS